MNRLNQTSFLKQLLVILLLPVLISFTVSSHASTIITVAGTSNLSSQLSHTVVGGIDVWFYTYNGDGIPATSAYLKHPIHAALDSYGNLYIADRYNNRIRKVDIAGTISTVAGGGDNGDGVVATSAKLHRPQGVTLDNNGNLYIGDTNSHRVRKVDATTGIISTVAGTGIDGFSGDNGPATNAQLSSPIGVTLDGSGNLYIAEYGGHRIRKVNMATGIISTVAGTGTAGFSGDHGLAISAQLNFPAVAILDSSGNLYIPDRYNHRIRKVDTTTGIITTVVGTDTAGFSGDNGLATNAQLDNPQCVAFDSSGNLYIADSSNNRIRKVDASTGIITTVVGTGTKGFSGDGGPPTSAELSEPTGIVLDSNSNLYIVEWGNDRVRKVLPIDPPVAPTDLKAIASSTQIDLSWKDNSNNETGFKIFTGFKMNFLVFDDSLMTITEANTTSYSHMVNCYNELSPYTFTYHVKATNEAGDSTEVITTATPLACPPSRPLKLVAKVVSETQIDLTWYDLSTNETGYLIERSNNDNLTWAIIAQTKANSTTYSDTGLTCGTTYYYHHHAINDGGQSLPSVDVNATTEACSAPPLAPTNLTAVAISSTQIDLSWTDNSNNETGFKVESPAGALVTTTAADAVNYSHTGLTCNTTYAYNVIATNSEGDSAAITASAATEACSMPPILYAGYSSFPPLGSTLNIGTSLVGTPIMTDLILAEVGNTPLAVGLVAITGANVTDFTLTSSLFPLTIAEGGLPVPITISCTPSATGVRTATLELASNDPNNPVPTYFLTCMGESSMSEKLSVEKQGEGLGQITTDPAGILLSFDDVAGTEATADFEKGNIIKLMVETKDNTTFKGFEGDPDCVDAIVTMDTSKHCLAYFEMVQPPVEPLPVVELPVQPSVELPPVVEPPVIIAPIPQSEPDRGPSDIPTIVELPCPTDRHYRIHLDEGCDAEGQTVENLKIVRGGSLADAIITGTITSDEGLVSNSILEVTALLEGGYVTDRIINQGLMKDFVFVGKQIRGIKVGGNIFFAGKINGKLAGKIVIASHVSNEIRDMELAPGTVIQGKLGEEFVTAKLAGVIKGSATDPALLENVMIGDNTELENVILGEGVVIGQNVKQKNVMIYSVR